MSDQARPTREPLPLAGAVLAGGRSLRMGSPKEGLRLPDGRPMMEAVLAAVEGCCPAVAVVGASVGFDCAGRPGLVHILDEHPGMGPLAGLEALLSSGLARGYLVAACDQPLLAAGLLARLLDGPPREACFFRDGATGEELDPLPGYFPEAWLPPTREALQAGRRSFRALVRTLPARWVPASADERAALASLNSPEDLARFRGASGSPRA